MALVTYMNNVLRAVNVAMIHTEIYLLYMQHQGTYWTARSLGTCLSSLDIGRAAWL